MNLRRYYDKDELIDNESLLDEALSNANSMGDSLRRRLGEVGYSLIQQSRYGTAIKIYDVLLEFGSVNLQDCANALWLVQNDNTGLPVNPERARFYLAAALPWAEINPPVYLNAAGVYMELGEPEHAMAQLLLAVRKELDLSEYLDEALFQPLQNHPRWPEIVANQLQQPVEPIPALLRSLQACREKRYRDALPGLFQRWRHAPESVVGDLIETIIRDKLNGRYACTFSWFEHVFQDMPEELEHVYTNHTRVKTDAGWLLDDLRDPRFTDFAVRMLSHPPARPPSRGLEQAWYILLEQLAMTGDRRAVEPLRQLAHGYPALMPGPIGKSLKERIISAANTLQSGESPAWPQQDKSYGEDMAKLLDMKPFCPRWPPVASRSVESSPNDRPPNNRTDTADTGLAGAADLITQGQIDQALPIMISHWQNSRNPRLADMIDFAEQRWLAADKNHEGAFTRLIDSSSARVSMEKLWSAKHKDDPRLTTALIDMMRDPPFIEPRESANHVEDFWLEWMATLLALRDSRAVEPLTDLADRVEALAMDADAEAEHDMYTMSPIGGFLNRQLNKTANKLKAQTQTAAEAAGDGDDLEALEAVFRKEFLARASTNRYDLSMENTRAALWRAVANDLNDDAPKLAYAKWVDEQYAPRDLEPKHAEQARSRLIDALVHYPRGLHIDLTPAEIQAVEESEDIALWPDEIEALIADHERQWLGLMAPCFEQVLWKKGFPYRVKLSEYFRFRYHRKHDGHLFWTTLEKIDLEDLYAPEDFNIPLDHLPNLKWLTGISAEVFVLLMQKSIQQKSLQQNSRSYEMVGINRIYSPEIWVQILPLLRCLPQLKTLMLAYGAYHAADDPLIPLLHCPEAMAEKLVLAVDDDFLCWEETLERSGASTMRSLSFQPGRDRRHGYHDLENPYARFIARFDRDAHGALSELKLTSLSKGPDLCYLLELLMDLSPGRLTTFVFDPQLEKEPPADNHLETVRALLGKFPRLHTIGMPQPCTGDGPGPHAGKHPNRGNLSLSVNIRIAGVPGPRRENARDGRDDIALRRIRRAKEDGDTALDLSGLRLRRLPEAILELKNLRWLNLRENALAQWPAGFGSLSNLRHLDLSYNDFVTLPEELANLKQLQHLYLRNNRLTKLPEQLGKLSRLVELELQWNQLTGLPQTIGRLRALRWLNLWANRLESLPDSMVQLRQLRQLNLLKNKLTGLPQAFGLLTSLQGLDLGANQLRELPQSMGDLAGLRWLVLYGNQLNALPPWIGHLKRLGVLWLEENQLAAIPAQIGDMENLRELNLSKNRLACLPPDLGRLSKLRVFKWHDNESRLEPPAGLNLAGSGSGSGSGSSSDDLHHDMDDEKAALRLDHALEDGDETLDFSLLKLTSLPAGIGRLTGLRRLELKQSGLRELPDEIGQCRALRVLNLKSNRLHRWPKVLTRLPDLRCLNLHGNNLSLLGEEIGGMTQLRELRLGGNGLETLPGEITHLTELRILDLGENKLTTLPAGLERLIRLRELGLRRNRLRDVPDAVCSLPRLSTLDLESNKLQTLPDAVGGLQQLRRLNLSGNALTALTGKIGELASLVYLDLSENAMEVLPDGITRLTQLAILSLRGNELQSLPEDIGACRHLMEVDIRQNRIVKIPDSLLYLMAGQPPGKGAP